MFHPFSQNETNYGNILLGDIINKIFTFLSPPYVIKIASKENKVISNSVNTKFDSCISPSGHSFEVSVFRVLMRRIFSVKSLQIFINRNERNLRLFCLWFSTRNCFRFPRGIREQENSPAMMTSQGQKLNFRI